MYDFKRNLAVGHKYEDIAIDRIFNNPIDLYRPEGQFRPYDFTTGQIAYEVKSDRSTYRTGNFCVEFSFHGLPSGITTTMADIYIFFVVYPNESYKVYTIPVCVLKKAIREKFWTHIVAQRPGRPSSCYIIPTSLFSEYMVDALSSLATVESKTGLL